MSSPSGPDGGKVLWTKVFEKMTQPGVLPGNKFGGVFRESFGNTLGMRTQAELGALPFMAEPQRPAMRSGRSRGKLLRQHLGSTLTNCMYRSVQWLLGGGLFTPESKMKSSATLAMVEDMKLGSRILGLSFVVMLGLGSP